jgi:hypothetical protein
MEGPQQQECEGAMQDELGYINTTIRLVSYLVNNS